MEIRRVVKKNGVIAVSLPLENWFQRLSRIGFILMRITGNSILQKAKRIPITKTPEYHYVGDIKSYNEMVNLLKKTFNFTFTKYTPIGIHRAININALHIMFKKNKLQSGKHNE